MSSTPWKDNLSPLQLRDKLEALLLGDLLGPGAPHEELLEAPGSRYSWGWIDKIRRGWDSQQWRSPTVGETTQPDRVKFVLPLVSLIPPDSAARLRRLFGEDFNRLAPLEVQTLVTADLEGEVSNGRLQWIRSEHPVELTKMLQGLATKGFLDQVGQKRWCRYRLPDWAAPVARGASPLALEAPPLAAGAPPLVPGVAPEADPVLLEVAKPAREKKKLTPALTKRLLRRLCEGRFLTAEQMALLLERTKDKLRDNFLAAMVNEGELQLRYPDQPTHPEQAYRSNPDWRER